MTKKKVQSTADEWKGFVNYHLPNDVKKGAAEYRETWDLMGNILPTFVEARYKLSISFNPKDDAVVSSATCKDPTSPNYQRTLTAFAPDMEESLIRLCYIHYVVFEGEWPNEADKEDEGW